MRLLDFFALEDVFSFLVDVLGNTYHKLGVMRSKPHSIGCSREAVEAVCLLCTKEFYWFLLHSDLSIIMISWSWMIFLAEPIKNTTQVNQPLGYLLDFFYCDLGLSA